MNWSKLFFGIGGGICLLLRIYLILTNMDPTTGFYLSGGFAVSFYNTLLTLSLIIIISYGLFKIKPHDFDVKKPILVTIASSLCGLAILLVSGISFFDFLSHIFRWSDPITYLMNSKLTVLFQLLRLLIGLSAGAALLSFAIRGGRMVRRSGMLITPALWALIYAVDQFMAYPQIADMSDRVLWLLCLLFFSLAMIGQARIIRGIKPEKGSKYLCAYGYACALCGLLLGISQTVTMEKVCTIETMQWILTTCMALHALAMASSCRMEGEK